MIYNITPTTFGTLGTRNGDLIAIVNILQWLRKKENNPNIKFHLQDGVLNKDDYVKKFYSYLFDLTDCFSLYPGDVNFQWNNVSVWDARDVIGDHVVINNSKTQEKKVVVFPVYDAQYNTQRNWSMDALSTILTECREKYPNHKKYICCKDEPPSFINTKDFTISTDFISNIEHIMTAEVFYGGDTGVSHFASALEPGPKNKIYYYSSRCMIHTIPFYYIQERRGELRTFWVDFTGATWV